MAHGESPVGYGPRSAGGIVSAPLAKPLLSPESYLRYVETTGLAPRSIDRHGYEEVFASVEQAAVHTCADCMPHENNLPIWVVRGARVPFTAIWPRVKRFI